jgi:GT2 family glycosyltransferase
MTIGLSTTAKPMTTSMKNQVEMATNWPRISIIMLNWNSIDDTRECLESLKKVTYPNYDIIVVDNASEGDDAKLLSSEYGNQAMIISNPENLGFPEGNNVGIWQALKKGSDFCLLLNNDTIVDPEFLSELVEVAKDQSIGVVGSKIYNYYEPNRVDSVGGNAWYWLMLFRARVHERDVGQFDTVEDRDFVYANGMLIKREVFEKVGLLDPDFFFGAEEYDYCIRIKRHGYRIVYVPTSKIWHKSGRCRAKLKDYPETQKLIKQKMGVGYYKYFYRLSRKHFPPVLFLIPFTSYYLFSVGPTIMINASLGCSLTTAIRYTLRCKDVGSIINGIRSIWRSRVSKLKK